MRLKFQLFERYIGICEVIDTLNRYKMGNFSGTKEDIVLLGCLEGDHYVYDCNKLLWFWRDHMDDCDPGSSKESSHTKWGYWVNEVHIHKSQCSRVKLNTWFGLRNQPGDFSKKVYGSSTRLYIF